MMTARKGLPTDPDLLGVDKALKRAAKSALAIARQTKTPCYVVEDGKIVDIAKRKKPTGATKSRETEAKG